MFWNPAFWQAYGIRIALGVGGSLILLGVGYVIWEMYLVPVKETARTRRRRTRAWARRWLSRNAAMPDESTRLRALAASPRLRLLQPPGAHPPRANHGRPAVHGPWKPSGPEQRHADRGFPHHEREGQRAAGPPLRPDRAGAGPERGGRRSAFYDLKPIPRSRNHALRTLTPVGHAAVDGPEGSRGAGWSRRCQSTSCPR